MMLPEQKRNVAVLTLSTLHGAVQRHAGVSEGKVVQLAIHVVCVALVALKTQRSVEKTLAHTDLQLLCDSAKHDHIWQLDLE